MINLAPFKTEEEELTAEKRLKQLVAALAKRLKKARRKVGARPDLNISYEIFNIAGRLARPLAKFSQSERDLLELIYHVVTDHDPYVADFIIEINPDTFSRYCLRAGIDLPQKGDVITPVKVIFWAAFFGFDVNSPDVMADFKSLIEAVARRMVSLKIPIKDSEK